ncbi:alpha/beta fold hydrolase [Amnibacterium sp.]|uniref:alpha/beta fold hydrolase n=1 Tax=Amnibacterium sp. TaxID=1872496 RepID=UPI003F7C5FE9
MADRLVVMCHPTPGSSTFDPDPLLTDRWGLHLVGLDRPGYGSTPALPPGAHHSLADRADEIAALVTTDERNADRISKADLQHCGVIGWGTGAVVAAALAARHPDLVDRLALVSPPTPAKAEELAQRSRSDVGAREALRIAPDDPALSRHLGLENRLDRMIEQAFVQGRAGIDGDRALLSDPGWTTGLADITADVLVLAGADDPVIGARDVRWWERHLPEAPRVHTVVGSAALTIADAWQDVLAHVAPEHGHIAEQRRDHGVPRIPELPST